MKISVSAQGPDADEALSSFQAWLEDDRDVSPNVTIEIVEGEVEPGSMAPDVAAISLIVSAAFNLANLTIAYLNWRKSGVAPPAPLEITVNETSIVVVDASSETASRLAELLESDDEDA